MCCKTSKTSQQSIWTESNLQRWPTDTNCEYCGSSAAVSPFFYSSAEWTNQILALNSTFWDYRRGGWSEMPLNPTQCTFNKCSHLAPNTPAKPPDDPQLNIIVLNMYLEAKSKVNISKTCKNVFPAICCNSIHHCLQSSFLVQCFSSGDDI